MGDVDHGRIRGTTKSSADRGNVIGAKNSGSEALRDVVGNKVAKYQEFFADVLIDADNFFLYVRRQVAAADERVVSIGRRKDTAIFATSSQQRLSIRV